MQISGMWDYSASVIIYKASQAYHGRKYIFLFEGYIPESGSVNWLSGVHGV